MQFLVIKMIAGQEQTINVGEVNELPLLRILHELFSNWLW